MGCIYLMSFKREERLRAFSVAHPLCLERAMEVRCSRQRIFSYNRVHQDKIQFLVMLISKLSISHVIYLKFTVVVPIVIEPCLINLAFHQLY